MSVQTISTGSQGASKMSARTRDRLLNIISPLALLVLWELCARFGFIDRCLQLRLVGRAATALNEIELGTSRGQCALGRRHGFVGSQRRGGRPGARRRPSARGRGWVEGR